jgi:hypothetical protein
VLVKYIAKGEMFMNQIENLYKVASVRELSRILSFEKLICEFSNYLNEISTVGLELKDGSLARALYLSDKTTEIILDFIVEYGDSHPTEILSLLAAQEYTVHNNLIKRYNLLDYILKHLDTLKDIPNHEGYHLLNGIFAKQSKDFYEKDVYQSVNNGIFGLDFKLKVRTYSADLLTIGRTFGLQETTLAELEKANAATNFLELPKNRLSSPNFFGTQNTIEKPAEEQFKKALTVYANELNAIVSKDFPQYHVEIDDFFAKRTDVDTDYFIAIYKRVPFHSDSQLLRKELIETISTFNKIEDTYFAIELMSEVRRNHYEENNIKKEPLFSI